MSTPIKIDIVEKTQNNFKNSTGIYFTRYTGLNVSDMTLLRSKFRENDVLFKVTKNTLTKIAAKNSGYDELDDMLVGQIGIAFSENDPSAPARIIKEFNKNGNELEVVGLLFEGKMFKGSQFNDIASLPTREELYSNLLSCLQQPLTKLASTLNGAMTKFVYSLESLKQKKS